MAAFRPGGVRASCQIRAHRQGRHVTVGVDTGQSHGIRAARTIERNQFEDSFKGFDLGVEIVQEVAGLRVPQLVASNCRFTQTVILPSDRCHGHDP